MTTNTLKTRNVLLSRYVRRCKPTAYKHCWDRGAHTVKYKVARFLVSTSVNSHQLLYVVMCHFGTSAEMSGPKDRSVRTYGPDCLGIRTEMSQCQKVSVMKCPDTLALVPNCPKTLRHWCRTVSGPNCLRSDVSVSS